jgi:hypothetical protein
MTRHAGAYRALKAWELCDRTSGATLGTRAYPCVAEAAQARAKLVALARQVSPECAADVQQRCDVRQVGRGR